MVTPVLNYLVVCKDKGGTYFTPSLELMNRPTAWCLYYWMQAGQGSFEDWRVLKITKTGWEREFQQVKQSYPSFIYEYSTHPIESEVKITNGGWKEQSISKLLEQIEQTRSKLQ